MVTLDYKDTKRFLKKVEEGLKHPVGPVPTPKLKLAKLKIKHLMSTAKKKKIEKMIRDLEKLEELLKKSKRKKQMEKKHKQSKDKQGV